MEKERLHPAIGGFLRRYWFRILCIGLAMYIFFKKDLSFQVNLRAPEKQEEVPAPGPARREKMTERQSPVAEKKQLFDFKSLFPGMGKEVSRLDRLQGIDESIQVAYLKRFAQVAVTERKKFGIPSSVILANGLLHSLAGTAVSGNNHFEMTCGADWTGPSYRSGGRCLREYRSAWESFRDHSLYLKQAEAFEGLAATDYQTWATALENAGFSDEPDLAANLVRLIEYFRLAELDQK